MSTDISRAVSDAARLLSKCNKVLQFRCTQCGKTFNAVAKTGNRAPKTCSSMCRSRAYRARQAESEK